jgi:hypothetical protein
MQFKHILTILESCSSGQMIDEPTYNFLQITNSKETESCHFISASKNDIGTGAILLKAILNKINENDEISLNCLFNEMKNNSICIENNILVLVQTKIGKGNFHLNKMNLDIQF